jgi:hypothetical protein
VVCVGGLPTGRPLPVAALPSDDGGWAYFRTQISDQPATSASPLGSIGVDCARFVFADAEALSAWRHEETIDVGFRSYRVTHLGSLVEDTHNPVPKEESCGVNR